jgi:hypothetical protein
MPPALKKNAPARGCRGTPKRAFPENLREPAKLHSGTWRICDIIHQMGSSFSPLAQITAFSTPFPTVL